MKQDCTVLGSKKVFVNRRVKVEELNLLSYLWHRYDTSWQNRKETDGSENRTT